MSTLKSAVAWLVGPLLCYLAISFVNASFDIDTWTQDQRAFCALLSVITLFVTALVKGKLDV